MSAIRLLARHFFRGFFEEETTSPHASPHANMVQTVGLLASAGAFFVLLLQIVSLRGWGLVQARYIFIGLSISVTGFVMTLKWDALFLDKRDYETLMPFPLPLRQVFIAKIAALGMLLGIYLMAVNCFAALMWPAIDHYPGVLNLYAAHITSVIAAGLFTALAVAGAQGILLTALRGRALRRASICVQTALAACFVMFFFLIPECGMAAQSLAHNQSALLRWIPSFWFLGLYERLRPVVHDAELQRAGGLALTALTVAAGVVASVCLLLYRLHTRKLLEASLSARPVRRGNTSGVRAGQLRDMLERFLLRRPAERATFWFIGRALTRSPRHRMFLAAYIGFGAAVCVMTFGDDRAGLLRLPLMLSFILISGLRAAFNFPAELRANWVFQMASVADARDCATGARKWMLICAIGPLSAAMTPVEFRVFPWRQAIYHLGFGLMLSVLLMEALFLGFRKIPFTCAYRPGKINLTALSAVYLFGFTFYSNEMAWFEAWLGASLTAAAAVLAATVAGYWALVRRRPGVGAESEGVDYFDEGDPTVQELDLRAS